MKHCVIFVLSLLPLLLAEGQIQITGLSRDGELTWSNCLANAGFSVSNYPVYAVERATTPTGPWRQIGVVTNTESFSLREWLEEARPALFVRVAWLNAAAAPPAGIYEVMAFDEFGDLALTGRVDLTSSVEPFLRGTWELGPASSWTHYTNGFALGSMTAGDVYVNLVAGTEGPYALDGVYHGNGFAGSWYRCGIACSASGSYTARRLCP